MFTLNCEQTFVQKSDDVRVLVRARTGQVVVWSTQMGVTDPYGKQFTVKDSLGTVLWTAQFPKSARGRIRWR